MDSGASKSETLLSKSAVGIQLTVTLSAPGGDLSQDRVPAKPKTQPMNAPAGLAIK